MPNMPDKSHLLIDLDGTITDPAAGIIGSVQGALRTLGANVPAHKDMEWIIGPPLRVVFPKLGIPPEQVERAVALYREYYDAGALFDASIHDGIEAAMRMLKIRGHRLFICTSKAHPFARRIMQHFGLADMFDEIHGAELDGRNDAKRDLIAHILKTHNLKAADCLMVGDTPYDVEGARANGIRTIGVTWGYGADRLAAAEPALIISHASELPGAVDRLGRTAT